MADRHLPRYVNYDKIYEDKDPNDGGYFADMPETKLSVGTASLDIAKVRAKKLDYFVLVTYKEGQELPETYRPLPAELFPTDDGTLFATVNPTRQFMIHNICISGIQRISRIDNPEDNDIKYLLGIGKGPGPETVCLSDLILQQYEGYCREKDNQLDDSKKGQK